MSFDYIFGAAEYGPTPTGRARPEDRRGLTPDDAADLLGAERAPRGGYDPTYWSDAFSILRTVGQAEGDRFMAWRVKRDLKFLRKVGWTPERGCGPLWDQMREVDLVEGGRISSAWKARLRSSAEWLEQTAQRRPLLFMLEG